MAQVQDTNLVFLVVEHGKVLLEEFVAQDHPAVPSVWQDLDQEGAFVEHRLESDPVMLQNSYSLVSHFKFEWLKLVVLLLGAIGVRKASISPFDELESGKFNHFVDEELRGLMISASRIDDDFGNSVLDRGLAK